MSAPQMVTLEEATWSWIMAAEKKTRMPLSARFIKAFMAGIYLSLGGTLVQVLTADKWLTDNAPGLLKVIQGGVFPIGLIIIVLLQADLVTASMAIFIMGTLKRKVAAHAFILDWTLVFIGNLAGALFYEGLIVHYGGILTPAMTTGAAGIGNTKVSLANFRQIFLRGIGCNLCVCIAVFQASLAKDVVSKILAAWGPIFVFVSCSYDHVVANFSLIGGALMTGQTNFGTGTYIWKSIVASLLGNLVGAALLAVPLLVCHGRDEQGPLREADPAAIADSPTPTVGGHAEKPWVTDVESGRRA